MAKPYKDIERYEILQTQGGRLPLTRVIILFSVMVMLLNVFFLVKQGYEGYYRDLELGQADTERITRTISDHIQLTFYAVDLALKRATEREYFNSLFGDNLLEDMQNNFTVWVNETPQISAMMMTDAKGNITAIYRKTGYKTWMNGWDNVASQRYFKAHETSDNPEFLYVGWQNSWITDHNGFVVLSRRLNSLDGSFGGIVLAAVDSSYIFRFIRSIELGKETKLILMRDDGQTLLNQITNDDEVALVKSTQPTVFDYKPITIQESGFDDELRVIVHDRIAGLHLWLALIAYGDDIFHNWNTQRLNDLIFLTLFIIFVLVITLFTLAIIKQMRRVQHSERTAILASQAKSDFLASMSHELRTPLNAIIGFSEMLDAGYFGKLNAKQKERLLDINSCGNHLLELINDILEFSKGEAGKIELRSQKMSLSKLIRETIRIFKDKSYKEGVTINYTMPDDMPAIMADERKIKQILLNLLSNALKFTDKGGSIDVSCGLDKQQNCYFSVKDSGKGMKESDIPIALSAFGQVHDDPAIGGTGLGLPLCKMFAELHGGTLTITSTVGKGTAVTVTIPAKRILWTAAGNGSNTLPGGIASA